MKLPFLGPVVPPHVFCLRPEGVTYASVRREPPSGFLQARAFAYPPGTLGTGPAGTPLVTRDALAEAVEAGRRLAERRLSHASVVFPDSWARMLPIDFDASPGSVEAARQMVLWKFKKLLPGAVAEQTVVFRDMTPLAEQRRLLVAAAPAEVLRAIEQAFESLGVRVGMLVPASLALFEGFSSTLASRAAGDYALLHRAPGSLVFIIARNGTPIFFRQRPAEQGNGAHDQEVRLSLSYYSEKLQGKGLSAAYLHDEAPAGDSLTGAFRVPLEPLSGRLFQTDAAFGERIAAHPELMAGFAAVYGQG
ncbi:MAG TPA: hypothetical protein VLO07_04070 [Thermoanaerobaculia bacterium]|nr:hypothetical protein [Thermoanaerobaculia bacterium]